jgi:hypothetical protein
MIVGGDHGDTAFQFGALVLIELDNEHHLDFEVMSCELICCKGSGRLLEDTILERLTQGLKIISTYELHLSMNEQNSIIAKFCSKGPLTNEPTTTTSYTPITKVFMTGDLAFQAMALGKESMAGHWCMQCKASRLQFKHKDCEMWTMEELVRCGDNAEKNKGNPVLGAKKKPWWPFIPLLNYLVPLLHCLIGIGNQLLDKLWAIINEHIAEYSLNIRLKKYHRRHNKRKGHVG